MPIYRCDPTEYWPVLCLEKPHPDDRETMAEFTNDEIADLRRVCDEWQAWQNKIHERFFGQPTNKGWDIFPPHPSAAPDSE